MENSELLMKAGEILGGLGIPDVTSRIQKTDGVITMDTADFGGVLPRTAVMELLTLSYKQNVWLGALTNVQTDQRKGTVPIYDLNRNVSEGVGENDPTPILNQGTYTNAPYSCSKFKANWYVTIDQLRTAAAAGIANFESSIAEAFANAIGNDKANIVINGDTSLGSTTSLNRMLRMLDGLGIKGELGNVYDAAGKVFGKGVFDAMLQKMPEPYRSDVNLRWLYNSLVDAKWREKLTGVVTALGDRALTQQTVEPPLGRMPLIVPQISDAQGPTAIAPTSATDKTTYIELVLTTLVTATYVATAALGVGRLFKVTNINTGISEICVGYLDTTLRIITAGLLGQTTVSATNTDYLVSLADETDLYLLNPKMITVVDCYDMESYRVFNPQGHRWEVTTFYYLDVLIPVPGAIVKFKRVAVTPTVTW